MRGREKSQGNQDQVSPDRVLLGCVSKKKRMETLTRGPKMLVKERRGRGGCACWAERKGEGEWAAGGTTRPSGREREGRGFTFLPFFCFISKAI